MLRCHISASKLNGRGLFAKEAIPAGEAVLTLQRPLICALDVPRLKELCYECFRPGTENAGVKACSGCKTVNYCSKKCQSRSWKREHKSECSTLALVKEKGTLPNAARAVLQMIRLSESQGPEIFKEMTSHRETILRIGGERAEQMLVLANGMHAYSKTKLDMEFVQHLFALVLTNSFTLWTPSFDAIGMCLDPTAAAANHSCDPNVITVFDGTKMEIRSLKALAKDDEIFVSYVDITNPFAKRQRELEERFYFKCACSMCDRGTSTYRDLFIGGMALDHSTELGRNLSEAQDFSFHVLESSRKDYDGDTSQVLSKGVRSCVNSRIWPEYRQPLPALRQELVVTHLSFNRLAEALMQAVKLYFCAYEKIYAQQEQDFHPIRVMNMWNIVMLALSFRVDTEHAHARKFFENFGCDFDGLCLILANDVRQLVKKSHGQESTFARQVELMWSQLQMTVSPPRLNEILTGALKYLKPWRDFAERP